MSSIFEALGNLPEVKPKKHFVNVEGSEIEVTLQQKLEMMKHGYDRYRLENGKPVLKPIPKLKSKWRVLVKSDNGYYFFDNDIHWPEKVDKGGKTWQIEYE